MISPSSLISPPLAYRISHLYNRISDIRVRLRSDIITISIFRILSSQSCPRDILRYKYPLPLPHHHHHHHPPPAVTEFARKTGDIAVLSANDLGILALTWDLEKQYKGGSMEHLRKEPLQVW